MPAISLPGGAATVRRTPQTGTFTGNYVFSVGGHLIDSPLANLVYMRAPTGESGTY